MPVLIYIFHTRTDMRQSSIVSFLNAGKAPRSSSSSSSSPTVVPTYNKISKDRPASAKKSVIASAPLNEEKRRAEEVLIELKKFRGKILVERDMYACKDDDTYGDCMEVDIAHSHDHDEKVAHDEKVVESDTIKWTDSVAADSMEVDGDVASGEKQCQTCDKKGRRRAPCKNNPKCVGRVRVRTKCKCGKNTQKGGVCFDVKCGGKGPKMCSSGCGKVATKGGVCYDVKCGGEGRTLCKCGKVARKGGVCYDEKCGGEGKNLCNFPGGCEKIAQATWKNSLAGITGIEGRCVRHGGGLRCDEEGCPNSAEHSSRGTGVDGKCGGHGGGNRCEEDCCQDLNVRTVARYIHPDTNKGICTYSARYMVNEQRFVLFDIERAVYLDNYFNFKSVLVLRAEHAFYFELIKLVPELGAFSAEDRALDKTVRDALYGKVKNLKDYRPDYFHLNRLTMMGLHGEFDERNEHEESEDRLRAIANQAGCGSSRTFYFRVRAHLDNKKRALFDRIEDRELGYAYFEINSLGMVVVKRVATYVKECLSRMKAGQMPPAEVDGNLPIAWF